MEETGRSVEEFLAEVPNETRRADAGELVRLMGEVTGQPPAMWGPSIIGFGRHHYRYSSGREGDEPVVAFSPRKAQLVLYVLDGSEEEGPLLERLGPHSSGKSCLYVKRLSDVDPAVLRELVERSVATVQEWPPSPAP